jgi:glycosyltransferase involved in cell wall biosynthesis
MTDDFKLGMVVVAVGLKKEADRLMGSFNALGGEIAGVAPFVVTEYFFPEMTDPMKFNLSKVRNFGIKCAMATCNAVVVMDADMLIPPGLFDLLSAPHNRNLHVWVECRNLPESATTPRQWEAWSKLPPIDDCLGACNFMSVENWLKIGGFDERCVGFGGEDNLAHARAGRAGINRFDWRACPLIHVAHPLRQWRKQNCHGQENMRLLQLSQPNYLKANT